MYDIADRQAEINEAILDEVERQIRDFPIYVRINGVRVDIEATVADRQIDIEILNPISFHNNDIGVLNIIEGGVRTRNYLFNNPKFYNEKIHSCLFSEDEREQLRKGVA